MLGKITYEVSLITKGEARQIMFEVLNRAHPVLEKLKKDK